MGTVVVVASLLVVLVAGWATPGRYDGGPGVKTRLPLAYQILVFQVGIVLVAAVLGTVAAVWQAAQELA